MKDPRTELAALSVAFRERLERAHDQGQKSLLVNVASPSAPEPAKAVLSPLRHETTPVTPPRGEAKPPLREAMSVERPAPAPAASGSRGKKLPLVPIEPELPDRARRVQSLAEMAKEVSTCRKCGLCETRTQTVFARGTGRTRVMFVGEAPGADEDRQGLPFVGRAGQLLDQIIDAAGFDRESVYVANILKCRPPQNRDPRPEETAACTGFLEAQIELVNPKIICALGRHAAQFLTGKPDAPMGQLRGRIHYYRERIMVLPTYHPAALLRNPQWKRVVWDDMQILRSEYLR
jgi:DNA polymerase